MVDSCPHNPDQLTGDIDCLQAGTLVVPPVPLLRAAFHLHRVVRCQGQLLEATTSSDRPRGNEIVQGQRVEGSESAARTLDGLVDDFGGRIYPIRIVTGGLSILDIVLRLELLETLGVGVVDVLGVGNELGRRRKSVGSRHFEWRTG